MSPVRITTLLDRRVRRVALEHRVDAVARGLVAVPLVGVDEQAAAVGQRRGQQP